MKYLWINLYISSVARTKMGEIKVGQYFSVFVVFLLLDQSVNQKHEIPSNFFGSLEVFSGYASGQQQYIDAFSLHPDHVLISGTIKDVESYLQTALDTGTPVLYTCTCLY